jgi:prevent-host-death family protein
MGMVGIRELRNRTADLLARARDGEDIIITSHGVPAARLEAIRATGRPFLTKADLLAFPQADPGLRDELARLSSDTTDDLGEIQ